MSRLTIDISDDQHKTLKAAAALQGKSIKQYTLEQLFPANDDDDHAWDEFKTLIQKRIDDGLAGKVSTQTIIEIADEKFRQSQSK